MKTFRGAISRKASDSRFALITRKGLTADDLKTTMFAYPTGASDISYML